MGYELKWEARGVIKCFFGRVDSDQVMRSVEATEADPRFDNYHYVINDFLSCTEFSLSEERLEEIAAIDGAAARLNPRIKVAVVATLPSVIEAAKQYATSPLTSYTTRIFSTLEDARKWIESKE